MASGELVVTINDDGSVKLDARKMKGSAAEIEAELRELAAEIGGDFKVEKHVQQHSHDHHSHDHDHVKGRV